MSLLWLGEEDCNDPQKVGPKAAHCSSLKALFNVPPGFCVPALEIVETASEQRPWDLSESLKQDIVENYRKLGRLMGVDNPKVAVRSSAIDEDSANTSFAGQHDTYLNINGEEKLLEAVVKCCESAQHIEATEYRKHYHLDLDHIRIAVLVEALVSADSSGVGFSINPVTENGDEIVINGNYGLGKSVVDGVVTPDTYFINKKDHFHIVKEEIHKKEIMTVCVNGGTEEKAVPNFLQKRPVFTEAQLREIAELIVRLEHKQGYPVDVEFAFQGDTLFLLQCRPISTVHQSTICKNQESSCQN